MPRKATLPHHIASLALSSGFSVREELLSLSVLAGGGSDRVFYRVSDGSRTWVVLSASGSRADIRPYVSVARHLAGCGIGVPHLYAHDDARHIVLMEDLGDSSLHALLHAAADRGEVMALYRRTVQTLARIHLRATPAMESCPYLRNRSFGYEALRWETDYFLECFIRQYCGIQVRNEDGLENELHQLATVLAAEPRYFMHRDFQSKNIYLTGGDVRVIDFQTATRGLRQYDLASLLKDAYFTLEPRERDELCAVYCDAFAAAGGDAVDRARFSDIFERAGLQRLMQALGAFAYLSMHKGKQEFTQYIPAGLRSLAETLSALPDYPALGALVAQAAGAAHARAS